MKNQMRASGQACWRCREVNSLACKAGALGSAAGPVELPQAPTPALLAAMTLPGHSRKKDSLEFIDGQQILVKQQDPDIGSIPASTEPRTSAGCSIQNLPHGTVQHDGTHQAKMISTVTTADPMVALPLPSCARTSHGSACATAALDPCLVGRASSSPG